MDQTLRYMLFSLCLLYIWTSAAICKPQSFHIASYQTKDGLPDNNISGILQDKQGFIWMATQGGLVRYDGRQFKTFTYDPEDNYSISNDNTHKLFIDSNNNFWVGTISGGLNRYNYQQETFDRYLDGLSVDSIMEDKSGTLWVGTYNGLLQLDSELNIIKRYQPNNIIDAVFYMGDEIYFSGRVRRDFTLYKIVDGVSVIVKKTIALFAIPDSKNKDVYWLSTTEGLIRYDVNTNTWELALEKAFARDGTFYKDNIIALATSYKGIIFYDTEKKIVLNHLRANDKEAFSSILSNTVNSVFKDNSGILWSGTDVGLMKIKPTIFSGLLFSPDGTNRLKARNIRGITEDSNGNIWLTTRDQGLIFYQPSTDTLKHFDHPKYQPLVAFESQLDQNDHLWIGSRFGLIKFNTKSFAWETFKQPDYLKETIFSMEATDSKKIIMATRNHGLVIFDPISYQADIYTHDENDPNSLPNNRVYYINKLPKLNKYGVSTHTGFSIFDEINSQFQNNIYQPLGDRKIFNIDNSYEDSKGNIWINSGELLSKASGITSKNSVYQHFTKKKGLIGRKSIHVIEDKLNNYWITTRTGLLRYNEQTSSFLLLNKSDGLPHEHFTSAPPLLSKSGELYMGVMGGLIHFDPDQYKVSEYQPLVHISGIEIDFKNIPLSNAIELSHQDRAITFTYVALDYSAPEKNNYAYKLEGFDNDWIQAGFENKATYTNIPPGGYTFRVKGTNSDGVWSKHIASIVVTVIPPWWATKYAYTVYALILILLIILIVKVRTIKIRKYANTLENEVSDRTSRIKELLDKKNDLFAHVSHELRTPLTLILGPINQLLEQNFPEAIRSKIQMVKRNSQRLLKMVDQLLTLAKATTPGLVERKPQNVTTISKSIITSVKALAIEKEIEIKLTHEDNLWVKMMPNSLETIILNLCVNAIKYTPNTGQVNVNIFKSNGNIKITVKDTGRGIPQDQQTRIFKRFTRVSKDGHGVGLGLALVKELIEAHEGNINVESRENIGTTFTMVLPAHIPNLQAQDSKQPESVSNSITDTWLEYEQTPQMENDKQNFKNQQEAPQVLIIDDEPDICEFLLDILSQYQCTIAHNGEDGINIAKENIPDLIISDIMMPNKDGFDVVKEIRNNINTSHIPIILLTAKGDKESRLKAYQGYIDDYITKPFDTNELIIRVQAILAVRDLLNQRFNGKSIEEKQRTANSIPDLHPKDKEFLDRLKQIVDKNYKNVTFNIKEMTVLMNMSERPLQRKLKALLGMTPNNYLKIFRLEKAADYLKHANLTIDEIMELIGIQSRSHFYAYFKAYFGATPKEFKNNTHTKTIIN